MTHASQAWLDWQRAHTEALQLLQEAQRAYHRTISGSAFAVDEAAALEMQKASLHALDAARAHLDEVRGRQPR
jgi:hypothetical protein